IFGYYFTGQYLPEPARSTYVPDENDVRGRLVTTISHEVGHNLGLRHEDNSNAFSIMKNFFPFAPSGGTVPAPLIEASFQDQVNELAASDNSYDHAKYQNAHAYL